MLDSAVLSGLQAIWQRHMLQVVQDMPSVHDLNELGQRVHHDHTRS